MFLEIIFQTLFQTLLRKLVMDEPILANYLDGTRLSFREIMTGKDEVCGFCEDGVYDSGGVTPWGNFIMIQCPHCKGTGKFNGE